jgi:hypothetical protein
MSEMVERVAKAICRTTYVATKWDDCTDAVKAVFIEAARAAIEAMRLPTLAMLETGYLYTGAPDDMWTSMIDEALK